MSFIYKRVQVEAFEVEIIQRNFMTYNVFSRVRKDKPNCGLCSKAFQANDATNLAYIKGKKNELFCDECAKHAISNGAQESMRTDSPPTQQ